MSEKLIHQIKKVADKYSQELIEIRHHIHANPELSYKEFDTSLFIQEKLKAINIPFEIKADTGVIGIVKGRNPDSRIVALRADMDALPITEENDIPYKSVRPGIMHACGHDVHTTCLIGAAKILNDLKEEWEGTVKLIFQPGEEKNPGGASILIKEGVLTNPAPERIYALHVLPALPVGKLSFRSGMVMASADEIYIRIKAKGGHAAAPQFTADPILAASHLVIAMQQIISRSNNPFNPSVLSITAFQGGNTTNVIPSEVNLMGTFRAMNEEWRFRAHELIKQLATSIVESMGAEIDIRIDVGYPCVLNNAALTETAKKIGSMYVGEENVEETELRMGAEDFAYYSHEIPGCFFRLGAGNIQKGITSGVHTPTFNIDEDAIVTGAGMMASIGAIG